MKKLQTTSVLLVLLILFSISDLASELEFIPDEKSKLSNTIDQLIGNKCTADTGCSLFFSMYNAGVDYVKYPEFSKPTSLKANGQTNGTKLSENLKFDAQFNDGNIGEYADKVKIEVSTQPDFSGGVVWQSNWREISSTSNGHRCNPISYDGEYLSSGVPYYWRIKFKNSTTNNDIRKRHINSHQHQL